MINRKEFPGNYEKIIDEAYTLYMPQVRYEIEEFYEFLNEHYQNRTDESYNVLEIGTKFGGTFYLWCMMNTSEGLNISIDMNDGGLHGGIDEQKMDERDEWFETKFNNCTFVRGNSHDIETSAEVNSLGILAGLTDFSNIGTHRFLNKWIDFLFIDGDHTKEGVKMDYEMYSRLVKKGSLICFHDIKDTPKHRERQVEVAKFWTEITENRNEENICVYNEQKYQIVEFIDPSIDWGGIGCLIRL